MTTETQELPQRTEKDRDNEIGLLKRLIDQLKERHTDDKKTIERLEKGLIRDSFLCSDCGKVKQNPDPCLCDLKEFDL